MEDPKQDRKSGGHLKFSENVDGDNDDGDGELDEPSKAVKAKLDVHQIKQMGALLKPSSLAHVDSLVKKHLRLASFQKPDEPTTFVVDVAVLILHGGIWRWMPDFALKPSPNETGRLHVGLLLGPYIVDWTDSNLVAIRMLSSCQPLVLVNQGTERVFAGPADGAEKLLRDAAAVVVAWNTQHKLDAKKHSTVAFVEELLRAVGAKATVAPRVRDVLADAQVKGGQKFEATFQADWAVLPGDKKARKHKFKTHEELDEFVLAMRKEHPDLETAHGDDWNYLLLLDRCFWCGVEGTDAAAAAERDRPRTEGCAFGPPAFQKLMDLELGSGPKKNQVIKKKGSVIAK